MSPLQSEGIKKCSIREWPTVFSYKYNLNLYNALDGSHFNLTYGKGGTTRTRA